MKRKNPHVGKSLQEVIAEQRRKDPVFSDAFDRLRAERAEGRPPMPEEQLQKLEDRALRVENNSFADPVVGLIAEVRKLRALILKAEWNGDAITQMDCCPWCCSGGPKDARSSAHESDCAAFSAPGVVR